VGRLDALDIECVNQRGESRRLAGGEAEHEPGHRRGVDDRVLERAVQAAPHEPGVKGVVAVLDQDRALGKAQKAAADVAELGRADQHGAVDLVPAAGIRVDGSPAVDQRVEKRQGAFQSEALGAHLENQERPVAGGLDVQRHEVSVLERRGGSHVGGVHRVLLPLDRRLGAARLHVERSRVHRDRIACLTSSSSLRSTARIATTTSA
jgi:hypothetical protein